MRTYLRLVGVIGVCLAGVAAITLWLATRHGASPTAALYVQAAFAAALIAFPAAWFVGRPHASGWFSATLRPWTTRTPSVSDERLQAAVEIAQLGFFFHDHLSNEVYFSPQMRAMHGLGPDEPITVPDIVALGHPDDTPAVNAAIEAAHDPAGTGIWNVELRIIRRDGEVRWLKERSQTIFEGEGASRHPVRTVGAALDITDRKRADEAVVDSRDLLQTVLDTIPVRVFWKDADLRYSGCNRPFAHDAGLSVPGDIVGRTDFDMGWREQAERYRTDDRTVMDSGAPRLGYEEPQTTPDGGRIWLRTSKVPLRRPDGTVRGVLGTYEDITEQKRAAEALQQAAVIVDNSPVVLFRWEAREGWPVVHVSANVRQFGYEPEDLLSGAVPFTTLVHQDDLDRVAKEVAAHSTDGEQYFTQRYRVIRRDGQVRWVEDRTIIERDADGRVTHYQGIVEDITARHDAETERERLIRELELRNAELERFTYTVSHDLKSPLITLRGFLGYLEEDALAGNRERVSTDVARLMEATDKMDRLLRELLELSRVGRVANPPDAVPFGEVVADALAAVEGRLRSGRIRVIVAPSLPVVWADRVRLVEVVQNLVDNSAKFMGDQPEPTIEIGARDEAWYGKPVLFVRDNGIGIRPEYHEKVFGLFDKLDPQSEGTGVGLALVKRIIEVHGGSIWVESPGDGRGASFFFTLPVPAGTERPPEGDR